MKHSNDWMEIIDGDFGNVLDCKDKSSTQLRMPQTDLCNSSARDAGLKKGDQKVGQGIVKE